MSIGSRAMIMQGVELGEGAAIVATGAVVTARCTRLCHRGQACPPK